MKNSKMPIKKTKNKKGNGANHDNDTIENNDENNGGLSKKKKGKLMTFNRVVTNLCNKRRIKYNKMSTSTPSPAIQHPPSQPTQTFSTSSHEITARLQDQAAQHIVTEVATSQGPT